jgi:hypothetical protein
MTDAASLGTILGVWAHPDDDIFLTAGLMATAVRAGNRVVGRHRDPRRGWLDGRGALAVRHDGRRTH